MFKILLLQYNITEKAFVSISLFFLGNGTKGD